MSDQPLTDAERTLPPHLGGHFGNTNTDEATLRYLRDRYKVQSLLDVGCGPGGQLDAARAMGIEALGVDGDTTIQRWDIAHHDYTTGPLPAADWDLIWCMEFLEHIEERFLPNVLATFAGGQHLYITAAPPGFPGHHHVNCQPESYWIELLRRNGWSQDIEATAWVRANGGHIFSQRQGLVFRRSAQF